MGLILFLCVLYVYVMTFFGNRLVKLLKQPAGKIWAPTELFGLHNLHVACGSQKINKYVLYTYLCIIAG